MMLLVQAGGSCTAQQLLSSKPKQHPPTRPPTRKQVKVIGIACPQRDCAAAALHLHLLSNQAPQRHAAAARAQAHIDAGDCACNSATAREQVGIDGLDLSCGSWAGRWVEVGMGAQKKGHIRSRTAMSVTMAAPVAVDGRCLTRLLAQGPPVWPTSLALPPW